MWKIVVIEKNDKNKPFSMPDKMREDLKCRKMWKSMSQKKINWTDLNVKENLTVCDKWDTAGNSDKQGQELKNLT